MFTNTRHADVSQIVHTNEACELLDLLEVYTEVAFRVGEYSEAM